MINYKIMIKFHESEEKYKYTVEKEVLDRDNMGIINLYDVGIAYIPGNKAPNNTSLEFYVSKLRDGMIRKRLDAIKHLQEDVQKLLEVEKHA